MTADNRSVHTDALATLGTIIDDSQKRDAIHLAVIPMVAKKSMQPGAHVDTAGSPVATGFGVGIVDPFLPRRIDAGERFWCVIYPRVITSLRHVWSHPKFDDEAPLTTATAGPADASRKWLEDMAAACDQTYSRLMSAAETWIESEDYTYDNNEVYKTAFWGQEKEFWKHYEIVTGITVKDHEASFFTCSC